MLALVRLFFKYYIPIVIILTLVNFFEPSNYLDKPIEDDPLGRFVVALFGAATFTGDGFSQAWIEYWEWLYGGVYFNGSNSNAIIELAKFSIGGYLLMTIMYAPIYAFGWATKQERLWIIRFLQMSWRRPRFRTLAFASAIGMLIILLFLFFVIFEIPTLVAVAMFFGSYLAFMNPIALNVVMSVADLYGIKPNSQTETFFTNISDAIEARFGIKQTPNSNSQVVSPQQSPQAPTTNRRTHQANTSGQKRKRAKQSSQKPTNWRDRINR